MFTLHFFRALVTSLRALSQNKARFWLFYLLMKVRHKWWGQGGVVVSALDFRKTLLYIVSHHPLCKCVVLGNVEASPMNSFLGLNSPPPGNSSLASYFPLTLFRQELYFPDVEVGNHSATCDVIIFDVTRLF